MTPRLLLALAAALPACGHHDTPVATYRVDPPIAGSGGAAAFAPTPAGADGPGGTVGDAGSGGEAAGPACRRTYATQVEGLTSRYKVVLTGQTWPAAERECEAEGAHLVVIDDDVENAWVQSIAAQAVTDSESSNQLAWIGMSDHGIENEFRWVTGPVVDAPRWADSEPNSLHLTEDCVEMRAGGEWNDDRCNANLAYVCECDELPSADSWCDTDTSATCGDCSTTCAPTQSCRSQLCQD